MSLSDRPELRGRRHPLHRRAKPSETVADASYRVAHQHPARLPRRRLRHLQVRFCESGSYDGGDYIEDALTEDEAARATCSPARCGRKSDCVVRDRRAPPTSARPARAPTRRTISAIDHAFADNHRLHPRSWSRAAARVPARAST